MGFVRTKSLMEHMPRRRSDGILEYCEAELTFKADKRIAKSITESLLPEVKKDKAEISVTKDGFKITFRSPEVGRMRAVVGSYLRLIGSIMKVLQEQ